MDTKIQTFNVMAWVGSVLYDCHSQAKTSTKINVLREHRASQLLPTPGGVFLSLHWSWLSGRKYCWIRNEEEPVFFLRKLQQFEKVGKILKVLLHSCFFPNLVRMKANRSSAIWEGIFPVKKFKISLNCYTYFILNRERV